MSIQELIAEAESKPTVRKRLFEAGEMKLLVLHFIAQQPKFSYDIIKDVSILVGGNYKPSTGTICPTINYLEEHAFTEAQLTADDRKQYYITALGQAHLAEHQQALQKTLTRFSTRQQIQSNEQYVDIKRAMENLKTSLRLKIQHTELTDDQIRKIAEHIDHAAVEIARL